MFFYSCVHPGKKYFTGILKCFCSLAILLILLGMNGYSQSWIQLGEDIEGQQNWESSGYVIGMSDDGSTVVIGAPYNDQVAEDAGKARVYHWESSAWVQKGNDIEGVSAFDELGYSVSISSDGNVIAAGAIQDDDKQRSAGYVRVLGWDGSSWVQMGQDITGEVTYDRFGTSVSLNEDGNTVAMGSRNGPNGEESGSVRVFTWDGSAWAQKGQDINGQNIGDNMGWSLDLDAQGNNLVVGVPQDGFSAPGFVQVYSWVGSNWVQKGSDLVGDANGDRFGFSASINSNGRIISVGARQNGGNGEQSGQLKVFSWDGAQWEQKGDAIYGSTALQFLGWSTDISDDGNTVAVGVPGMTLNEEDGTVEVYIWNNSQWELKGDVLEGDIGGNRFGWSVAMSSGGDFVAVGTPFYTGNNGAGQVKVFTFGFTGIEQPVSGMFTLYPNPVKDKLTIDLHGVRDVVLAIKNMSGQVVFRERYESSGTIQLNVDLPEGIYTVELETSKGFTEGLKIIKVD
jgi:hypothetical protein